MTVINFQLVIAAEAEVTRGCCGRSHEFGPCPFQALKSEEDSP